MTMRERDPRGINNYSNKGHHTLQQPWHRDVTPHGIILTRLVTVKICWANKWADNMRTRKTLLGLVYTSVSPLKSNLWWINFQRAFVGQWGRVMSPPLLSPKIPHGHATAVYIAHGCNEAPLRWIGHIWWVVLPAKGDRGLNLAVDTNQSIKAAACVQPSLKKERLQEVKRAAQLCVFMPPNNHKCTQALKVGFFPNTNCSILKNVFSPFLILIFPTLCKKTVYLPYPAAQFLLPQWAGSYRGEEEVLTIAGPWVPKMSGYAKKQFVYFFERRV